MKELYIAPEVEILCFTPVEALANGFWQAHGVGGNSWGDGGVPESDPNGGIEYPVPSDPTEEDEF